MIFPPHLEFLDGGAPPARLVGIAVAAQVVGHHVEFLGEIAPGDLLDPGQMALRKAVDEQDFGSVRIDRVVNLGSSRFTSNCGLTDAGVASSAE